jgi:hypothetical protein
VFSLGGALFSSLCLPLHAINSDPLKKYFKTHLPVLSPDADSVLARVWGFQKQLYGSERQHEKPLYGSERQHEKQLYGSERQRKATAFACIFNRNSAKAAKDLGYSKSFFSTPVRSVKLDDGDTGCIFLWTNKGGSFEHGRD